MHRVNQQEPSESFKIAWQSVGRYLNSQIDGGLNWLRADLNPPVAEHLSFTLGNQLFFIFIEAAEFDFARSNNLFLDVCSEANAIPCLLRMNKCPSGHQPVHNGWGLIHAINGNSIDPVAMVSDELIEMSDWELHDFAVQIVKKQLGKENKHVFSAQSSLHIDPSIWFEGEGEAHWVVVREVRYPQKEASQPLNLDSIKASCAPMGKTGYFASVAVANAEDSFDSSDNAMPLYRGAGMYANYEGLQAI
jgi:hypothetical protein